MSTTVKDLAERTAWTFVQAFGGTMTGDGVFDLGIGPAKAAAVAGIGAVITLATVVARQRLAVLDTRQRPLRANRTGA